MSWNSFRVCVKRYDVPETLPANSVLVRRERYDAPFTITVHDENSASSYEFSGKYPVSTYSDIATPAPQPGWEFSGWVDGDGNELTGRINPSVSDVYASYSVLPPSRLVTFCGTPDSWYTSSDLVGVIDSGSYDNGSVVIQFIQNEYIPDFSELLYISIYSSDGSYAVTPSSGGSSDFLYISDFSISEKIYNLYGILNDQEFDAYFMFDTDSGDVWWCGNYSDGYQGQMQVIGYMWWDSDRQCYCVELNGTSDCPASGSLFLGLPEFTVSYSAYDSSGNYYDMNYFPSLGYRNAATISVGGQEYVIIIGEPST